MKRSRFSEEQIIGILKEHQAGLGAKELCRKHGISDATFYKLRSKYGGMEVSDARRLAIPQGPNQRWSLDFMSDALEDGRRFRVPNVIDDFSRECLAAVVDTSIGGARVARELVRITELRGYPCLVVSDNGTELTSNAMLKWQEDRKVGWHYIAPGKPMQHGLVESFNGWMR